MIQLAGLTAMVTAYFLLPLDRLGPRRPVLSWVLFGAALGLIAVLLLVQVARVLLNDPGARRGWLPP
ncbi:Voltage-gated potassium channel Kch OS=Streptomyces albaduncus OX=68172 GN=FHS32_004547 PE=4 SV=1 [Streptomyces griseoloalbus]